MQAMRPVGQAVKTSPSHGENMGSIPVRVTKIKTHTDVCVFCIYMQIVEKAQVIMRISKIFVKNVNYIPFNEQFSQKHHFFKKYFREKADAALYCR